MRINKSILLCALLVAPALNSFGAFNVIVNSNGGPQFRDTDGGLLSGSIIRAGYFTADPAAAIDTAILGGGFGALNEIFRAFGEDSGTTADGTFAGTGWVGAAYGTINDVASAGHVNGQVQNVDQGYAGGNGQQLALWVINSNDLATATSFGVFSANDATWKVPALGAAVLSTLNINESSEILAGTPDAQGLLLQRIIPEPSVAAFLGLGSLLVFRRRK